MKYSSIGLHLTEISEGTRLVAYLDTGGVPTIGNGHTEGVCMGMTCTPEQAEQWLAEDVAEAEDVVNEHVKVPLTQDMFDALVDFVFNVGGHAFINSTLLRKLNAGDYEGADEEFKRWNKDDGRVVAGLVKRRAAEARLFVGDENGLA